MTESPLCRFHKALGVAILFEEGVHKIEGIKTGLGMTRPSGVW